MLHMETSNNDLDCAKSCLIHGVAENQGSRETFLTHSRLNNNGTVDTACDTQVCDTTHESSGIDSASSLGSINKLKEEFAPVENSGNIKMKEELSNIKRTRDYICGVCGKAYYSAKNLRTHMAMHDDERKHSCQMCGKSFTHRHGLNRHAKLHTGERSHVCQFCGKTFIQAGHLRQHLTQHTSQYAHYCPHCNKGYNKKLLLDQHVQVHTIEEGTRGEFGCEQCGAKFKDEASLCRHMKEHQPKLAPSYHCGICGLGLRSRQTYRKHLWRMHKVRSDVNTGDKQPIRVRKVNFGVILQKAESNSNVTINDGEISGEEKRVVPLLDMKSESSSDLKDDAVILSHLEYNDNLSAQETGTNNSNIIVPLGNTESVLEGNFTLNSAIIVHPEKAKQQADLSKPHVCKTCNGRFVSKSSLSIHMRQHDAIKPFGCELCSRTYTTRNAFLCHLRWHIKDRPYICVFCPQSFYRSHDLKRHLGTHTGEKTYFCVDCGKTFVQISELRSHEKVHTREKNYECALCNKRFPRRSSLRVHIKKHAEPNRETYVCPICEKSFIMNTDCQKHMESHVEMEEPEVVEVDGIVAHDTGINITEDVLEGEKNLALDTAEVTENVPMTNNTVEVTEETVPNAVILNTEDFDGNERSSMVPNTGECSESVYAMVHNTDEIVEGGPSIMVLNPEGLTEIAHSVVINSEDLENAHSMALNTEEYVGIAESAILNSEEIVESTDSPEVSDTEKGSENENTIVVDTEGIEIADTIIMNIEEVENENTISVTAEEVDICQSMTLNNEEVMESVMGSMLNCG